METATFVGLAGVPVVIALLEVWKGWVSDKRTYPLVAIVIGIVINVAIAYQQKNDLLLALLVGVVVGLASSGLYSSGKAIRGL